MAGDAHLNFKNVYVQTNMDTILYWNWFEPLHSYDGLYIAADNVY